MTPKLIHAVAHSTRLRVIEALKRTHGLAAVDLAERLSMSYTGIKDVCADLLKAGLLDLRREPKPDGLTGRPRMIYRLTERALELFPNPSNPLTLDILEAARKLHGPAAAEKLLHSAWQLRAQTVSASIQGNGIEERAIKLAHLRDAAGHMASLEADETGLRIVEHHCPYLDVLKAYPIVARLDADLFRLVLGCQVDRRETTASALYQVVFVIAGGA